MSENIQNTTTEQIETLEQQLAKIHLRPRLAKFCENILCKKTRAKSYTEAGFKAKNDNVANFKALDSFAHFSDNSRDLVP